MSRRDPAPTSAVILVIELEQSFTGHAWEYALVFSRAGREGTFRRAWKNASGRLSASQAQDLISWASESLNNALITWGGIQEDLDVR